MKDGKVKKDFDEPRLNEFFGLTRFEQPQIAQRKNHREHAERSYTVHGVRRVKLSAPCG
ncbi:hypothetical protein ABZR88_17000 [Mucilaginibacter yixingensis]|uniref:hypothetical protein n=1 Tax=Mucilaginibacter yixingensis TaxID=1295612 RepID=UPI0014746CD0|nr:hypothetical protein [Mucilaginibacter yixingensis]